MPPAKRNLSLCRISPCERDDFLPNHMDQLCQFFLCGLPADGDAEGAVNDLRRDPHGLQNMAPMTLGAGTACGHANAMILQNVDGILGRQTGDGQRQNMGCFVSAVDDQSVQRGQLLDGGIQQLLFTMWPTGRCRRRRSRKWPEWPRCRCAYRFPDRHPAAAAGRISVGG